MANKKSASVRQAPKKGRSPKTPYHHGDLKNALLVSAIKLLRHRGPQSFSLRELALSLGVSSAAPYRHFKTKEKIFAAIAVQGFARLTEGFASAIESHPLDAQERLHAIGRTYHQFAVKHPEHLQMMFGNIIPQSEIANNPEFKAAATKAFGLLVQAVKSCQAIKALDPKEDPKMLAIIIWSAIHGFSTLNSAGTLQGASGLTYNPELVVKRISKAISGGLKRL